MTFFEIALLFFFGVSTIVGYWLVGRISLLIFNWKSIWPVQIAAISIVAGFTLITVFYSLLRAHQLKTLSAVIVVIAFVWLILRKKSGAEKLRVPAREDIKGITGEWRGLALTLLFFLLIFLVQLIKLDAFDHNSIPLGSPDFPFYITVSEQLNIQGIENVLSYLNQIHGITITSSQPYHFFDLWFNAFLQWVIPSNHVFIYLFVYIPQLVFFGFLMMVYIGYFLIDAFCEDSSKLANRWWWIPFLTFPFLFLIGYFPYSKIGHNGFEFLEAPLFNNPKYYYSYLLLALGIPLYKRGSYLNLAFLLLMACYFFIVYVPIAVSIMTLIVCSQLKVSGLRNLNRGLMHGVILFAAGILLFELFYWLQPGEKQLAGVTKVDPSEVMKPILKNFFSIEALVQFIRAYAAKVIYFVPFIALTLSVLWSKTGRLHVGKLLISSVLLILIGGFWSFVFNSHIEGFQFLGQTFSAGLYMTFFIAIFWVLIRPKTKGVVVLLILIGIQFILSMAVTLEPGTKYEYAVSSDFKEQIIKNKSNFSSLGLNILTHQNIYASSRNISPYLNYYTDFVKFLPDVWLLQAAVISPEELNKGSNEFRKIYLESPFVQFRNSHQGSFAENVKLFMTENNISFFVWRKGNIDDGAFADVIDHTISDPRSGYCISFVKPPKK